MRAERSPGRLLAPAHPGRALPAPCSGAAPCLPGPRPGLRGPEFKSRLRSECPFVVAVSSVLAGVLAGVVCERDCGLSAGPGCGGPPGPGRGRGSISHAVLTHGGQRRPPGGGALGPPAPRGVWPSSLARSVVPRGVSPWSRGAKVSVWGRCVCRKRRAIISVPCECDMAGRGADPPGSGEAAAPGPSWDPFRARGPGCRSGHLRKRFFVPSAGLALGEAGLALGGGSPRTCCRQAQRHPPVPGTGLGNAGGPGGGQHRAAGAVRLWPLRLGAPWHPV